MSLTKTFFPRGPNVPGRNRSMDSWYGALPVPCWQQFGRGVPVWGGTWGNVFYVDDGGAGGTTGGRTPEEAVTTADAATNLATANNGDLVLFLPGHNESITAAAGWDNDVAGVTYCGLGRGADRPTLSFLTATTADVDIDAASITVCNFLCTNDLDAIAAAWDVNAADFAFLNCEWRDVTGNALVCLLADANADRLLVDGFFMTGTQTIGSGSGISDSPIVCTGNDNPVIRNSTIITRADISLIECRTTAVVRLQVYDCILMNLDNRAAGTAGTCVEDVVTGSTGCIGPRVTCILGADAANITEAITGATFHVIDPDVQVVNAVNEKSIVINWTASTDA